MQSLMLLDLLLRHLHVESAMGSASITKSNVTKIDLRMTQEGADIVYFPSDNFLCLGYIRSSHPKFCTCATCSTVSHKASQLSQFQARLYIKAGGNAVCCSPVLPAGNKNVGMWREHFALYSAVESCNDTEELSINLTEEYFIKRANQKPMKIWKLYNQYHWKYLMKQGKSGGQKMCYPMNL
eukprot:2403578-Ditylum_brightwellii.AAC.1